MYRWMVDEMDRLKMAGWIDDLMQWLDGWIKRMNAVDAMQYEEMDNYVLELLIFDV